MQLLMAAMLAGAPAPPPVDYRFEIRRSEGALHNPWTLSDDKVELRSFVGSGAVPGAFVAPTIRVSPGQKLTVELDNRLEPCSDEQRGKHLCFNDTNLHTHGLWVSPAGKSDNVLIAIKPGERFRYEYDIPADHPAGTFWYHPHRHGGGFVQVGSGMAGALIVTGDRKPTAGSPGDIDILLKDSNGRPLGERVMLFQQIQYGCLDAKGEIAGRKDEDEAYVRPWTCAPGEAGRIESFEHDWDWVNSGRFTGINGKVQPLLAPARAGAFERWRLIHGGTRERIRMRLHRLDPAAPALGSVLGADQEQWLARYCTGDRLPIWHIAMDGLTRSAVRRSDEAVLFPGDRMDVLVRLPAAGRYCLVQDATSRKDRPQPRRALAVVEATGDLAADGRIELDSLLAEAARRALSSRADRAIRERVLADLADGMKLSAFVWHKPIGEEEVSGYREATLNILETPKAALFHVNGRAYDHERIDHSLPLGKAEEWRAASLLGGHPLHIHVNPFQIISVTDAQARDVTDPDGPAFDPDYAGLKGEWKDTVFIKENHRIAFRTRYERFTGDFVIHCHIMFHGDHGMMQNLRIASEGEAPRPFGH
ncbi:MAG TPA: multicopper oxidase family protein [Sphingomicrobium sp.]|nr:multicopper oxidase family protein [Sphingomicrobium sp.]